MVAVMEGSEDTGVVLVDPLFRFGLDAELTGGDQVEIDACEGGEGGREGG
jgi:hypothetical protein